jgi:hypothetical protein
MTNLQADGDLDRLVDTDDYNLWKQNFGKALPISLRVAAVPEPPTWLAGMIALSVLFACRLRWHQ